MVWTGRLHPESVDVTAENVSPRDYAEREAVSFMSWSHVMEYFEGRDVIPLIEGLLAVAKGRDAV